MYNRIGIWISGVCGTAEGKSVLPEIPLASDREANLSSAARKLRGHLKDHKDPKELIGIIALADDLEKVSWEKYKQFLNDDPTSPFDASLVSNKIRNEEATVKNLQAALDNENPTKIKKMWIGVFLDEPPGEKPPVKIISVTIPTGTATGADSLSLPQKP